MLRIEAPDTKKNTKWNQRKAIYRYSRTPRSCRTTSGGKQFIDNIANALSVSVLIWGTQLKKPTKLLINSGLSWEMKDGSEKKNHLLRVFYFTADSLESKNPGLSITINVITAYQHFFQASLIVVNTAVRDCSYFVCCCEFTDLYIAKSTMKQK